MHTHPYLKLWMMKMAEYVSPEFQETLTRALELSPAERMAMIAELVASFQAEFFAESPSLDDQPFTSSEIAELMQVEPLPPAEVIARGLLGTWTSKNIEDGAAWVNERKAKRRERHKWSTD